MFSGSWKESSESEIGIDVPDDNIDIKGKDRSLATLPVCSVGHGRNHLKVRLALMYQMTTLISKVRIEVKLLCPYVQWVMEGII